MINWRWGNPSTYERPINSINAVAAQLDMLPTTVLAVLRQFEKLGFRNNHRVRRKNGGRVRRPIGSPALEAKLLSDPVLEAMAPLSIARRVEYIKQKYHALCSPDRLRALYKLHNITFRVSSTQWRVSEHEVESLEQQRREYAQKLDEIMRKRLKAAMAGSAAGMEVSSASNTFRPARTSGSPR